MLKLARARKRQVGGEEEQASSSGPSRTEARFEKNWSTASKKDSKDSPRVAAGTGRTVRVGRYRKSRESRRSFRTRPPVCSSGQ